MSDTIALNPQIALTRTLVNPDLPKQISYQGVPGANSHIAAQSAFPDHDPCPADTFEDALALAERKEVAVAMIPVENSVAGRVADIHHLLPEADLTIVGEFFLPINHQLLAVPGAPMDGLKFVHSHMQALEQCRTFIRHHRLTPVVEADTAGAARLVSKRAQPEHAAIASALAAQTYGLDVRVANIEDSQHNVTRFLILTKDPKPMPETHGVGQEEAGRFTSPTLTSFVFTVRNIPAALYKCLGGFATNGINMTKLESYQIEGSFLATQFYADVEGHPKQSGLANAFDELDFFSHKYRILGVYPGGPLRKEHP